MAFMLAVKGYYDGSCVQLLEPICIKKNQNIIIHIEDDFIDDTKKTKSNDKFLKALENDKFVVHTGLNVEEYMRELRDNDRI